MAHDLAAKGTTTSVQRRPTAGPVINHSAAASPRAPLQRLRQRLGNQGTIALANRLRAGPAGAAKQVRPEALTKWPGELAGTGGLTPPLRNHSSLDPPGLRNLSRSIQTKLTISQPGDIYEQEADRVADQVMRMAGPPPQMPSVSPVRAAACTLPIQRLCAECEEELSADHKPPMPDKNGARGRVRSKVMHSRCGSS
jgi:hypothetical protein